MWMTSSSLMMIIWVVISSYTVVDCSRLTAVRAASTRRRRYWPAYAVVLYTGITTNGVSGHPFCYFDIWPTRSFWTGMGGWVEFDTSMWRSHTRRIFALQLWLNGFRFFSSSFLRIDFMVLGRHQSRKWSISQQVLCGTVNRQWTVSECV